MNDSWRKTRWSTSDNNAKPRLASSTAIPTSRTAANGYPDPVVISTDSSVSGYFIDRPRFGDVAVLVLRSFGPQRPAEFQRVVENLFAMAIHVDKKRLVVDVQNHSGGYVLQG